MHTNLIGSAFFSVVTLGLMLVMPPVEPLPAAQHAGAVIVEGCLVRDADVPGRTPTAGERRGPGEDYILINTRIIEGFAPLDGAVVTVDGTRSRPMFEIAGLGEALLGMHVGHRVQIDGAFHHEGRVRVPAEKRIATNDLVELHGHGYPPGGRRLLEQVDR